MNEPKYCIECKWCVKSGADYLSYQCTARPQLSLISKQPLVTHCMFARNDNEQCGFDAKWFEPIQTVDVFR